MALRTLIVLSWEFLAFAETTYTTQDFPGVHWSGATGNAGVGGIFCRRLQIAATTSINVMHVMVQMKWTAGSNKVHYEMKADIQGKGVRGHVC